MIFAHGTSPKIQIFFVRLSPEIDPAKSPKKWILADKRPGAVLPQSQRKNIDDIKETALKAAAKEARTRAAAV